MIRTLAAAAVTLTLALAVIAPASAQTDPIRQRQQAMKENGRDTKLGGDMLKGAVPFDAAKARQIFVNMNEVAARYGSYFPANSKTGNNTEAAPAIWEKPAEFKAAIARFEADTKAAAAADVSTPAAFGAQFGKVTANCKSCHETFRLKLN
jgi:cytochrome c556